MNKLIPFLLLLIQSPIVFAAIKDGRWHAGIGDASVFGWVTVAFYVLAAARCLVKANASRKFGGYYQFWLYLAAFLLLLGMNKQLDLQSWLTEFVKDNALVNDWYLYSKRVKFAFILALGLGMLTALLSIRLFLANSWRHNKLTWWGIILLCTFILIRAASFHHFDILINRPILGLTISMLLEVGAILLIIVGTFFDKKSSNLLTTDTFDTYNMNRYAEIPKEGDDVQCPQCGVQPLAKTIDGRLFKCRKCGNKFIVRVAN
jgi:DNA-directed RNA polymerase subunit RPC12/RpoP